LSFQNGLVRAGDAEAGQQVGGSLDPVLREIWAHWRRGESHSSSSFYVFPLRLLLSDFFRVCVLLLLLLLFLHQIPDWKFAILVCSFLLFFAFFVFCFLFVTLSSSSSSLFLLLLSYPVRARLRQIHKIAKANPIFSLSSIRQLLHTTTLAIRA